MDIKTGHIIYNKVYAPHDYWCSFDTLKGFPKIVFSKNILNSDEIKILDNDKNKLCDIYNGSDIEALDYMYEFLKDNHNPEMLELLDRVHTLNMETTLGWGREDYTTEESEEYFNGKWELLNYFGIKSNMGDAYID